MRWNYLENKKLFWNFFLHFWNLVSIWNIFKKNMTLVTDVLRKLRPPKNMIRSMPEKSRFKVSVENQHGEYPQTLFKFERQPLYHIYWSLGSQLSYKKSLLVICKISNLFPNTLCSDGKYSLLDRGNLKQRIQMELSRKQKPFSSFFSSLLKFSLNLEHFKKKMTLMLMYFLN